MKKIHLIGNAHLDPAWMWRWAEGFAAFAATCRSAFDRIAETDDFIFTVSSAACFEFIEQSDPKLFSLIQDAVKAGKWSLVGGWWVEADCNLPSGESLIRQGLYGQQYFKSKFGVACDTGYLIDSFGHTASLPMLLQACGMKNFVFMRPEEHEKKLTSALFNWRSASGDEVLAYRLPLHYSNFALGIKEKAGKLPTYELYSDKYPWMLFYGVGNHGGGPTKEQIKQIFELQQEKVGAVFSTPSKYFEEIRSLKPEIPTIEDEMQPHAIGCYSAHAEIKRLNREAEFGLVRAEIFSALSEEVTSVKADWHSLQEAWKLVLLNQFHDTLGGVAIKEAMNEAVSTYQEAISVASRNERFALQRIASTIDTSKFIESLVVFNPNNFATRISIEFALWNPEASEKGSALSDVTLVDSLGTSIPTQKVEASGKIGGDSVRFVAIVDLPALGWNAFGIIRNQKTTSREPRPPNHESRLPKITAAVYDDPTDTWGHGISGFSDIEGEFTIVEKIVIEDGSLRSRTRIRSTYNNSELIEDFIQYQGSNIVEHRVRLNWQEKRKVCKLRFAHSQQKPSVRYEIPYGSISRPADGNEVPVGTWAFVENSFGVISPVKSSYACDDKYLSITIARSALYAHHEPPHKLTENEELRYLDLGEQEFTNYVVLDDRDWQSARMPHLATQFSQPPVVHIEYSHGGELPGKHSWGLFDSGEADAILTTLKKEHGRIDNSLIARFINSYGIQLNNNFGAKNTKIHLGPQEVKTCIVDGGEFLEADGLEQKKNGE